MSRGVFLEMPSRFEVNKAKVTFISQTSHTSIFQTDTSLSLTALAPQANASLLRTQITIRTSTLECIPSLFEHASLKIPRFS